MPRSAEIPFAADHATAAGHFPGNPIIPGALLLDEIVHAITGHADNSRAIVIRSAKFFRPVRPGESILLQWHALANDAISFECHVTDHGDLAARGMVELDRLPR
jgi:3-hydroxyacyl-[acyl-carrier-protein] dehydratase